MEDGGSSLEGETFCPLKAYKLGTETQLKKEENLQRKLNQHSKNFLFLNIDNLVWVEKKLQIYLD